MSKKLHNIKAVQQMLDGEHKFQSKKIIGFKNKHVVDQQTKHRDVGDIWEETTSTGTIYVVEQKDGYRVRKTKKTDLINNLRTELKQFPNCRKETCTCAGTHSLDKKMQTIHKMCFDCVIDMEHELKKAGTYAEYEQQKIRDNALAWLESAERDVVLLKDTYTQASKFVTSSEGETEKWSAKMTPEEFDTTIQKQFDIFKENFLNKLNGEQNENN